MAKNEGKSGFNKNILLMVILVPLLVLVGVIAGYYILPTAGQSQELSAQEEKLEDEIVIPLDEFLVNLNPTSNKTSYVRMEISLATQHENGADIIPANLAKIRDTVIYTTNQQTKDTLFNESDGSLTLKDLLILDINEALGIEVISNIYVTDFIVQ